LPLHLMSCFGMLARNATAPRKQAIRPILHQAGVACGHFQPGQGDCSVANLAR